MTELQEIFARHLVREEASWRMPERKFPLSVTDGEGFILNSVVRAYALERGIEIGTGFGVSACWIAQAMKMASGGRLYSFDTYEEERSEDSETSNKVVHLDNKLGLYYAHRMLIDSGLGSHVGLYESEIIAEKMSANSVDFAFIDGFHHDGAPLRDIKTVEPLLRYDKFVVAFHDDKNTFVAEAVDWLARERDAEVFRLATEHKLTFVAKGLWL